MKLSQGSFSYLPELSNDEIKLQIQYAFDQDWTIGIEFSDNPYPPKSLWEMWGLPMFDMRDSATIIYEVNRCRQAYPNYYIRITAHGTSLGRQFTAFSFIVNRPKSESEFIAQADDFGHGSSKF